MAHQFTDTIVSTLREHAPKVRDQFATANALYGTLKKQGKVKKHKGGYEIGRPVRTGAPGAAAAFAGSDTFALTQAAFLDMAKFDLKRYYSIVSWSGTESDTNKGEAQILDLLEEKIDAAEQELVNRIAADFYSDGTANRIDGLGTMLSATPAVGSYGGIDRVAETYWRHKLYDFSVATVTPSAATFATSLSSLVTQCNVVGKMPDLIILDSVYWNYLDAGVIGKQQFQTAGDSAQVGYEHIKFKNATVVLENMSAIGSNIGYVLDTSGMEIRVAKEFEPFELGVVAQEVENTAIIWSGNLINTSLRTCGRIQD